MATRTRSTIREPLDPIPFLICLSIAFATMAVAGVLTEIEDRLHILIEDDEVDGDMLESFGSLTRYAASKALR